jgi:hypothetical protein
MMKSWVGIAVLLAGCWSPNPAMGCSCMRSEPAGFIHADVTHLPSNARGALFLPPAEWNPVALPANGILIYGVAPQPLSPSSFTITSDAGPGRLPVEMTVLDLRRDAVGAPSGRAFRFTSKHALARFVKDPVPINWKAMLKAGTLIEVSAMRPAGLVRVGPVGGFKPGRRYTIAYTGVATSWTYPAQVELTIDTSPVRTGAEYQLALDGEARRQLLEVPDNGGMCSNREPATVQNFHYVIPDSHKPYQDALLYFSESRAEPVGAARRSRFAELNYSSSMCDVHRFGEAALGHGAELISSVCGPGAGRASIRGWVGMLEVEDRLRPTEPVQVDFSSANGGSCNAYGMLKQAMASREAQRTEVAVCEALALGPAPQGDDMPSMADLFALTSSGSAQARTCARGVLAALLVIVPAERAAFLKDYGKLLVADLDSAEPAVAEPAESRLFDLWRNLSDDDARHPERAPDTPKLLEPVLPVLLRALTSGTPAQSRSAGGRIGAFGEAAMPLLPALLKAAESQDASAVNAAHALAGIIPDDPRLHRILLRNVADPALLVTSALDYNLVAGKLDPAKAIALLTDAARLGSEDAIVALGRHGLAARASMPVLITLMEDGGSHVSAAFDALLKVTDGEPEALAAYARAINAGPGKEVYSFYLDGLAKFKGKGQAFLPAIALRMQRPMSAGRQASLKKMINSMALKPARRRERLARLAKVTLTDEPY